MQQLVYAMEFKGTGEPVDGQAGKMRVRGEASSSSITTVVHETGVTGGFDPAAVAPAIFESVVSLEDTGRFREKGSIRFGETGPRLFFEDKHPGWIEDSPVAGLKHGAVVWSIEGGEGQFSGASGIITSNFTIDDQGVVNDRHLGVIYIK